MDIFTFAFMLVWFIVLNSKIDNLNKKIDNLIFNDVHGLSKDSEVLK